MAINLTETFDNMYTTTWQLMRKAAEDVIFTSTPFWFWLTKKGRRRTETGGRWIGVPLMYAKNTTVAAIGKGGTVSISDIEHLTTAKYDWKYIAGSVVRYFVEEQENRGKSQIINLVRSKLDNLKLSMIDKLETDAFADGTGDSGMTIGGLDGYIKEAPATGTIAGINRATYTWWRNQYLDLSAKEISVYMVDYMRTLFNNCAKGAGVDHPDFLMTDQGSYEDYMKEADEIHRVVNKSLFDAGFESLQFMGIPLSWSDACKGNSMYFLNSKYIEWVAQEGANFAMTDWKSIPNQVNDRVAQVILAGNIVFTNFARQGVLFDIGESS